MTSQTLPVDYWYTRAQLRSVFEWARSQDVESGGRYDAASCGEGFSQADLLNE